MNMMGSMSVNELIERLGGTAVAMEVGGVGRSAVSNWRRFGCIPPRLYLRFAAAGRERGVEVPEHLFSETRTEAA